LKSAGIGITLTAGTLVVFAELDWTPAMHHQAEDRAHRIGQTKQVKVVTFVLNNPEATDVHIWDVLKYKEELSESEVQISRFRFFMGEPRLSTRLLSRK
jgi:SWI/SNF-related matrix-associated actin-dependent regulator of chromatin subfamily A-like protein 1